jgi:ABC-type lipoprotein release transport system permease subunit
MSRAPLRSLPGLAAALARHWWPQVMALAAACAVVATTVIGALGVGDSIRGGLRSLATARLGRIDAAIVADGFFRRQLAAEVAAAEPGPRLACTPALVLPATVAAGGGRGGAARATLLACDDPAALGFEPPPPPLEPGTVVVNAALASAAGVAVGDDVVLRLPARTAVPADSPLGRRTGEAVGRRLRVAAVLPGLGLGRFSLRASLAAEPLAVLSLSDAQAMLREGDVANTILVVGDAAAGDVAAAVRLGLRPRIADFGLAFDELADGGGRLSCRRLVIPPEVDRAAAAVLGPVGGRPTLAFLATAMSPADGGEARVPYSTVLGIDATPLPSGPLVDAGGRTLPPPGDDEMLIDRWMADDLAAQGRPVAIGDHLAVTTFVPETVHGRVEERTERFRIAGIAEMRGAAIDRSLVPEVEGVTDEDSIADWDPPFPFDAARVRTVPPHDEDDRYWKEYRATPKAFVSLATARRVAGSRFGATTAWHVPAPVAADLAERLAAAIDPARAGMRVVPLRDEALAASRGSTPFGGLFLALSLFVVAAGVTLVWLLFGLLVAAQRRTIGTLAAVGFPPRRLVALLTAVGGIAAVAGVVAGMAAGPLWARLLLAWLARAWERDVVAGSADVFAKGHAAWPSLVAGAAGALAVALASVALAARRAGARPPLELLRGPSARRPGVVGSLHRSLSLACVAVALAVAVAAAVAAGRASAGSAAGLFFVAGAAALVALLAVVRTMLVAGSRRPPVRTLAALARRMLTAQPGRGFAVAAIVACGQFLVVAVSAFAVRPPADPTDRASPTGGWTTIATFGEPTSIDPADDAARANLGLSSDQERAFAGCTIAKLRVSDGDDASCTNLFATTRPSVIGVGPPFIDRGGFRFLAHEPLDDELAGNPWRLIERAEWHGDTSIPVVLDQATAQWGLKLGGVGSRFPLVDEAGETVECRIVGLLEPGILQGRIVVSEQAFERLFPARSGYSMALIDSSRVDAAVRDAVPAAVRAAWADAGVSLEPSIDRLRSLLAVQNTFLSGFQALGALGLLLGTAGVAAVRAQGVAERIGALSVLRAVGFTPRRVRGLLVLETLAAVVAGLVAGTLAGAAAVWPALVDGSARVPVGWIARSAGLTLLAAVGAAAWASGRAAIPERPTVA